MTSSTGPQHFDGLRVALVHDWLLTWRGGEKVLAALSLMFPGARIFTLFHDSKDMPAEIESHEIISSWLDRIPGARTRHRSFLPLMPLAASSWSVGPVDLVISSSHCVAKAVRVPRGARHLSYVHAPLRYMWDQFDNYFGEGRAPVPTRLAARLVRPAFQLYDVHTAKTVDHFVANSRHVQRQIEDRYRRSARVVHPPVELTRFMADTTPRIPSPDYYLCVGALAPYKRVDLAIEAFRRMGRTLWIGGSGQSRRWLDGLPSNVKALGQVSDAELPALYRNARALVFPGIEDFGLTPLEAQASGRPVIAFGAGGVLETVTSRTGVFFEEQSSEALVRAVEAFERWEPSFDPAHARLNAARFSLEAFQTAMAEEVRLTLSGSRLRSSE
jgi:glycosyltransferase involved in cell wall biosynthesis